MKDLKAALILGFFAGLAVFVGLFLPSIGVKLYIWIMYLAWTSYYFYGADIKVIPLKLVQEVLGMLIAIFMIFLADFLTNALEPLGMGSPLGKVVPMSMAFILAWSFVIFLVITPVYYLSKLKVLNDLTAYFIGMITWFGISIFTPTLLADGASSFFVNLYPPILSLILGYAHAFACVELSK